MSDIYIYHAISGGLVRWLRSAVPNPPPTVQYRFPGDTLPKVTGKFLYGIDELDKDPYTQSGDEAGAPASLAATPPAGMAYYYTDNTCIATPGTSTAYTVINHAHSKGWIPWIDINYGNWEIQSDGRNSTTWYNFIAWVEQNAVAPVFWTFCHEPDASGKAGPTGSPGTKGTYAGWYNMCKAFRTQMNNYAANNGPNYVFKKLAFAPVFTAQGFANGSVDLFIPDAGTSTTFDFMGVDPYVHLNENYWTNNFNQSVAWCENSAHLYPLGIRECAVDNRNTDGATKILNLYNRITDGTHDIFCWNYYNSDDQSSSPPTTQYILNNVNNGGMLNQYVTLLKGTNHYWDLTDPIGNPYPRPAGV